jgi:uncharacterized OB-fold protein
MHRLLEDGALEIGRRVEPVFRPSADRVASILDVDGFRLA